MTGSQRNGNSLSAFQLSFPCVIPIIYFYSWRSIQLFKCIFFQRSTERMGASQYAMMHCRKIVWHLRRTHIQVLPRAVSAAIIGRARRIWDYGRIGPTYFITVQTIFSKASNFNESFFCIAWKKELKLFTFMNIPPDREASSIFMLEKVNHAHRIIESFV